MTNAAKRRATYEDLLGVPENMVGEIIDGELVVSPRPGTPHARANMVLGTKLSGPFDLGDGGGPGGWLILAEPELRWPETQAFVPDMAGWRRERMPVMPEVAAITMVPDWICEVVSPESTEKSDRSKKMPAYARAQVSYLWLVSPLAKTLEAYAIHRERWIVLGTWTDDAKVRVKPFDAIELDLAALWSR